MTQVGAFVRREASLSPILDQLREGGDGAERFFDIVAEPGRRIAPPLRARFAKAPGQIGTLLFRLFQPSPTFRADWTMAATRQVPRAPPGTRRRRQARGLSPARRRGSANGQDNLRRNPGIGLQAPEDFDSIDIRQLGVKNYGIRCVKRRQVQRFAPTLRDVQLHGAKVHLQHGQHAASRIPRFRVVIGEKDNRTLFHDLGFIPGAQDPAWAE